MSRRTLDTRALTDFVQTLAIMVRRVRTASESELSWTQAIIVKRLAMDGPATIAELARAERLKPQSMGTTVAALEEMRLIQRNRHPTDGRQVHIELTAKGAAMQKRAGNAAWAWLAQAIAGLDEEEQETLFAAGEIIKRLVQ